MRSSRSNYLLGMSVALGRIPKLWLLAGGALILVLGAGLLWSMKRDVAGGADANDPELVALGSSIYAQRCASCHGAHLEGQPNWREHLPNGRLPAPPHNADGHTWHHSDRQLFEITKNGPSSVVPGYQSDMPGFKNELPDKQIWAVLAYIKSTWPPDIKERQERINQQTEANAARGR